VFALAAPKKLGRKAHAAVARIDAGRDEGWVPAAVVAEVALLHELGRVGVGVAHLKGIFDRSALRFLPLDLDQLDRFETLAAVRDPFDRLIVSAARALDAKLVSRDAAIAASGLIETVWS
jgi:PIN domain nuclease of toxin-antitoxin system